MADTSACVGTFNIRHLAPNQLGATEPKARHHSPFSIRHSKTRTLLNG